MSMPTNGTATPDQEPEAVPAPGPSELIREAEALHAVLSDARLRTAKLVASLRRHRRRHRAVESTLAALRQLKLAETAR
jgi:hypothetical protein